MTRQDWSVSYERENPPGYRWLAEHPDRGESYFRTRREAEAFVRRQTRP